MAKSLAVRRRRGLRSGGRRTLPRRSRAAHRNAHDQCCIVHRAPASIESPLRDTLAMQEGRFRRNELLIRVANFAPVLPINCFFSAGSPASACRNGAWSRADGVKTVLALRSEFG